MARDKSKLQNINLSDPSNYLNGRIKDNTGSGNGTPVNERVYGDFHQTMAKLMSLAGLVYNDLPDNETNGYQLVESIKQLASKNDYNYELSSSNGFLTLPVRVNKLQINEIIRAKAGVNKGAETSLRGTLDNNTKAVTYLGDFKVNEYVRIINLSGSLVVIREVDAFNLGTLIDELEYLKGATQTEEDAGSIDTKATTPKTNKTTFGKRINGTQSNNYLASTSQNGLLSKEFWNIINGIGTPALKNRGSFVLGDINNSNNPVGTVFVSSGDITTAEKVSASGTSNADLIKLTFANAMDSTNYKLDITVQSLGTIDYDNDFHPIVFKVKTTNSAEVFIQELSNITQNIKIHIDVIQL